MILEETITRIKTLIAQFVREVEASTSLGLLDINRHAENVLVPLFAEIYGYTGLTNLNSSLAENYPAVDLGDKENRVAIQITATTDLTKIRSTLSKFREHELFKDYDKLLIYILTNKQRSYSIEAVTIEGFSFNPKTDIIDHNDLLREIKGFQVAKAQNVCEILEQNFRIENGQRVEKDNPNVEPISISPNDFVENKKFIGREQDINLAVTKVLAGSPVMVTGPAGVGKTTFCKEVVSRVINLQSQDGTTDTFPDGKIFIDARNIAPSETGRIELLRNLIIKLGVNIGQEITDWSTAWSKLQSLINTKQLLVVLDNVEGEILYEHFLKDAVQSSATTTTENRGPTFLINARLVPLIKVAKKMTMINLNVLSPNEAQQLFLESADIVEPGTSLDEQTLSVIDELVSPKYLGGLPLAIELVGATVQIIRSDNASISLRQILLGLKTSLDQNLVQLLQAPQGISIADHHQNITLALSLSYNRVDEATKLAFESICIIPSTSFEPEAAAAAINLANAQFAPQLSYLKRASLLQSNTEGRYTLHSVIKKYGLELLRQRAKDVIESIKKRLLEYYKVYAEANYHLYGDPEKIRLVAREWDNFKGCLRWCKENPSEENIATLYTILRSTQKYIEFSGAWLEGLSIYEDTLLLAEAVQNDNASYWLLYEIASLYLSLGKFEEAEQAYKKALTLAYALQSSEKEINALQGLSGVLSRKGDNKKALEQYKILYKRQNLQQGKATAAYEIVRIMLDGRDYVKDEVSEYIEKSSEFYRAEGDIKGESLILHQKARFFTHQERYKEAIDLEMESIALSQKLNFRVGEAVSLNQIGYCYAKQNQNEEAFDIFQKVLLVFEEIGDSYNYNLVKRNLEELAKVLTKKSE